MRSQSSEQLEEQLDRQRAQILETAAEINHELSPGELLDRYYFQGKGAGLSGYLSKIKEDPVPGALLGAAIAWTAGKEQTQAKTAYRKSQKNLASHPVLNVGLGFSLGVALASMMPVSEKEEELLAPAAKKLGEMKDRLVDSAAEKINHGLKH